MPTIMEQLLDRDYIQVNDDSPARPLFDISDWEKCCWTPTGAAVFPSAAASPPINLARQILATIIPIFGRKAVINFFSRI